MSICYREIRDVNKINYLITLKYKFNIFCNI